MKVRVSSCGHHPRVRCAMPGCVGHVVERRNSFTGELFMSCSEWSNTGCCGYPTYTDHYDYECMEGDPFLYGFRDWGDL